MASLPGTIFDEYSTLSIAEKAAAVAGVGADISFSATHGPGTNLYGGSLNDVFLITNGAATIRDSGGVDIAVSSASWRMSAGIEHLILTGQENLIGFGNSLNNVIAGNDGNNILDGDGGNDLLLGGAGDDLLKGGSGQNTLDGGTGNDILMGGGSRDTLSGGDGNDSIQGDGGNDIISGGAGNDAIFGDAGNDTISGGNGTDCLMGGGGLDTFVFGSGDVGTTTILDFTIGEDAIGIDAGMNVDTILASLTHDAEGNAVFTIGSKTVVLAGIDENDVTTGFFHIVS